MEDIWGIMSGPFKVETNLGELKGRRSGCSGAPTDRSTVTFGPRVPETFHRTVGIPLKSITQVKI